MSLISSERLRAFALKWRNASYSTIDHVVMILLWAVSTPVFILQLGEDAFGIWFLITTLVGMGAVVSFGFGESAVRFVSKYHSDGNAQRVRQVVEASMTLYAVLGGLVAVLVFALAPWLSRDVFDLSGALLEQSIRGFRLAGVALFVSAFMRTMESTLMGFQRYDITAKLGLLTRATILLVNIVLALSGFSVATMVLMTLLGLIFQGVVMYVILRRDFVGPFRLLSRPEPEVAREVLTYGFQIWLQVLGGALSNSLDRFLIGALFSPAAAGIYGVCIQLAQQIHLILMKALAFVMPATSELVSKRAGVTPILEIYASALNLTVLVIGATAPAMFIMAPQILTFWISPEFAAQGTDTLRGLVVAYALFALVVSPYYMLNGAGQPKWNTVLVMSQSLLVLALIAVLVPEYGVMGAVYARILSFPVQGALLLVLHRTVFEGRGWALLAPVLVAVGVFALMGGYGLQMVADWAQLPVVQLFAVCIGISVLGIAIAVGAVLTQRLRLSGRILR